MFAADSELAAMIYDLPGTYSEIVAMDDAGTFYDPSTGLPFDPIEGVQLANSEIARGVPVFGYMLTAPAGGEPADRYAPEYWMDQQRRRLGEIAVTAAAPSGALPLLALAALVWAVSRNP